MNSHSDEDADLILAAEECPPDSFEDFHKFSQHDEVIIRKLSAHGPVLLRGGRGSGKSALLIEAFRRMRAGNTTFPVYVSLRHLPLLQSDGQEYIGHFCTILSDTIRKEISERNIAYEFPTVSDQVSLQLGLTSLSQEIERRVVLLFDDAAHIGREKPLEVFFDLFRTISSSFTSCKATIYPGVTKFGVRFDVFNDSTVIDISRSDINSAPSFFPDVVQARYPALAQKEAYSEGLSPTDFANLLGRAVLGNIRGFILACNRFNTNGRIGIPEVNKCFLDMATDYYWPLMDEVAPKLGVYEPLINPARETMEAIVEHLSRAVRDRPKPIAQDRVTVHRQIVSRFAKIFEVLEYLGFVARREASRGMKSGGRGPVFAINLCNLLDAIPTKRLTAEMIQEWTQGTPEPAEIHITGQTLQEIALPDLPDEHGLTILDKPVSVLKKSTAYPYGLTNDMIDRLQNAGLQDVGQLANATHQRLFEIDGIGEAKIRRIREVVYQAIWM